MDHAHSSCGIEGQGHKSRSGLGSQFETRSVGPQSSVKGSFLVDWLIYCCIDVCVEWFGCNTSGSEGRSHWYHQWTAESWSRRQHLHQCNAALSVCYFLHTLCFCSVRCLVTVVLYTWEKMLCIKVQIEIEIILVSLTLAVTSVALFWWYSQDTYWSSEHFPCLCCVELDVKLKFNPSLYSCETGCLGMCGFVILSDFSRVVGGFRELLAIPLCSACVSSVINGIVVTVQATVDHLIRSDLISSDLSMLWSDPVCRGCNQWKQSMSCCLVRLVAATVNWVT